MQLQVLMGNAVVAEVPATGGTFRTSVSAGPGTQVCAVALNTGAGVSTPLGCVSRP